MTDRFVPDKPGLYFYRDVGGLAVAEINSEGFWIAGSEIDQHLAIQDWIAPVTPPDVVADLVAALEAVMNQDVDRYEKAHDALRRYRDG